jgi:hypothetical protein
MNGMMRSCGWLLVVAALVGCGSSEEESAGSDESNVESAPSTSPKVSLENWKTHPQITTIGNAVLQIEIGWRQGRIKDQAKEVPCGRIYNRFAEGEQVRKLVVLDAPSGEPGGEPSNPGAAPTAITRTTYHYRTSGKLLRVLHEEVSFADDKKNVLDELTVFFDDAGEQLIAVEREHTLADKEFEDLYASIGASGDKEVMPTLTFPTPTEDDAYRLAASPKLDENRQKPDSLIGAICSQ